MGFLIIVCALLIIFLSLRVGLKEEYFPRIERRPIKQVQWDMFIQLLKNKPETLKNKSEPKKSS